MDSLQTSEGVAKRVTTSQRKVEYAANGDEETGDNCEVPNADSEDTGRRVPANGRLDRSRSTTTGDVTMSCKQQQQAEEEDEEETVCDSSSSTRVSSRTSRRKVEKPNRRKRERLQAGDECRAESKVARWPGPEDAGVTAVSGSSNGLPASLPSTAVSCIDVTVTSSRESSGKGASPTAASSSSAGTPHLSPQDTCRSHDTPGVTKKTAGAAPDNSSMFLMPHFGYPRRHDCLAGGEGSNSFVRDLEEVMNRHLPIQSSEMLRRSYAAAAVDCHKLPSPTSMTSPADVTQAAHSSRESVICTNIYSPYIANVKDTTAFYRGDAAGHRQYKTPAHTQVGYAYTPPVASNHVTDDVSDAEQQLRWRYSERPLAAMWPLSAAGLADSSSPFFSPYYGLCNNYTHLPSSYDDSSKTYW